MTEPPPSYAKECKPLQPRAWPPRLRGIAAINADSLAGFALPSRQARRFNDKMIRNIHVLPTKEIRLAAP
jgi:hypothetical protein